MTKRQLIEILNEYPDSADVMVKDLDTNLRYKLAFISWKNSSERIIFNFRSED